MKKSNRLWGRRRHSLQTQGLPFRYIIFKIPVKEKWIENYLQASIKAVGR